MFGLRESGKTNDAMISDCGTLTKAQCKTNFKTAAELCLLTTATELIAFGWRCRNNSARSPGGDSSGTSDWLILLFSLQNNTASKHCLHLFTGAGRYNAGSHPEHRVMECAAFHIWFVVLVLSTEHGGNGNRHYPETTSGHGSYGQRRKWFPAKTLSVHMLAVKQEHKLLYCGYIENK